MRTKGKASLQLQSSTGDKKTEQKKNVLNKSGFVSNLNDEGDACWGGIEDIEKLIIVCITGLAGG